MALIIKSGIGLSWMMSFCMQTDVRDAEVWLPCSGSGMSLIYISHLGLRDRRKDLHTIIPTPSLKATLQDVLHDSLRP